MTEEITLQVSTTDAYTLVAVAGEIDISTAPQLREAIARVIEAGAHEVIVDLDDVRFMDSSGLNTLLGAVKQLTPGSLGVVAGQAHIRRIFSITGTDKVIQVFDSRAAAIEAVS